MVFSSKEDQLSFAICGTGEYDRYGLYPRLLAFLLRDG